jgi:hypothetical protein
MGDDEDDSQQDMLHALPTDYETLADDMDTVLDNLKNLLTNPNFVAVDEVEMREEEIHRLRAGWEKMEARLRESFILMDSWRKRMTNGDTINLEELKMGFGFSEGFETVDREGFSMIQEESEAEEAASSALEEDVDDAEEQEETGHFPSPEPHEKSEKTTRPDMFRTKLQPSQPALRESNGNKSPIRSPRKVAFSASIPNTPSQLDEENADASGIDIVHVDKTSRPTSAVKPPRSGERASRPTSQDRPRHVRYDTLRDQVKMDSSHVCLSFITPSSWTPQYHPGSFNESNKYRRPRSACRAHVRTPTSHRRSYRSKTN